MLLVNLRLVVHLVADAALPLLLHLLRRAPQDLQSAIGLYHPGNDACLDFNLGSGAKIISPKLQCQILDVV